MLPPEAPEEGDFQENYEDNDEDEHHLSASEIIAPNTIVAVRPNGGRDPVWFVKVLEVDREVKKEEQDILSDSYGVPIPPGTHCIRGQFLEKDNEFKKHTTYRLGQETFFLKGNVVYPYVAMEEMKNHFVSTNDDFVDIIMYIETNGFSYL